LEYAEKPEKMDEEVEAYGNKIWVDSMAIMKVLGSTMDFVETDLSSEFVFENPNAKGACGCGESWHV
jgi:iron-sulfur cluster assembly protein